MDFPLSLTLVLMMLEEEAAAGAAPSATETTERPERPAPWGGIPRSSGVFSVVEPTERADRANRTGAQVSSRAG
jgi:hypothetical protein